ncbi:MAG: D-glycero-beta-D-manno-heptose 1-phosphate adenylyltransferase [candidate division Zixibacteria bacterium]|nr:D-glycero-beta-D-manno-heptose 1-phosphate adenylyltransferase [candidate division Zixibacteria bacterium]
MIISQPKINSLVENLRRRGKIIVFTNGVFDILHYGHISYLTKAKKLGDILIIGLNSDSSVKKFKEKNRPIQNEKDRARILAALKPVDYVILFSEPTPEKLIKLIKPDILVKGADYKSSEIVGADFVKSYGGTVKRIKIVPGRSSTNIIRKLNL